MYVLVFWPKTKQISIVEESDLITQGEEGEISKVQYKGKIYKGKVVKKSYDKKYLQSLKVTTDGEILIENKCANKKSVASKANLILKEQNKLKNQKRKKVTNNTNKQLINSGTVFDSGTEGEPDSNQQNASDSSSDDSQSEETADESDDQEQEMQQQKEQERERQLEIRQKELEEERQQERNRTLREEKQRERDRTLREKNQRGRDRGLEEERQREREREIEEERQRERDWELEEERQRKRDRELEEERQRERDRELEEERQRERERELEEERQRERDRELEEEKQRERERELEEERQRERDRELEEERQRERDREFEEERQRERDRERERQQARGQEEGQNGDVEEDPLVVCRQGGNGKVLLCDVWNVWIDKAQLTYFQRFRKTPKEMTRRLLKTLIGTENLKNMCARGRATRRNRIPEDIMNAVEYYVNEKCTKMLKPAEFTFVTNAMICSLRNPRR